jgi:hypothetical protein
MLAGTRRHLNAYSRALWGTPWTVETVFAETGGEHVSVGLLQELGGFRPVNGTRATAEARCVRTICAYLSAVRGRSVGSVPASQVRR